MNIQEKFYSDTLPEDSSREDHNVDKRERQGDGMHESVQGRSTLSFKPSSGSGQAHAQVSVVPCSSRADKHAGQGAPFPLQRFSRLYREDLERKEEGLSVAATKSSESMGRLYSIEPDDMRTAFQRDRDRILHSKSFRRLSHKTQVFLAPEGDHYRTRLTHTLEVSQIARAIARALSLNEDLTEAIALGHDLGHTPFGHTGEDALSYALARYRGLDPELKENKSLYRHSVQSVRVVEKLENKGEGLNLTREVLDGILCHNGKQRAFTYEGRIVATADRIAYVNHDIDDAIRAGLISESDLPRSTHKVLGYNSSQRISTMVHDMISYSCEVGDIMMSPRVWDAMMELRTYLFDFVYHSKDALREIPRAFKLVGALFDYYIEHIDEVPREYRIHKGDDPSTQVVDYVAGMTDRYAISTYEKLFIPKSWSIK